MPYDGIAFSSVELVVALTRGDVVAPSRQLIFSGGLASSPVPSQLASAAALSSALEAAMSTPAFVAAWATALAPYLSVEGAATQMSAASLQPAVTTAERFNVTTSDPSPNNMAAPVSVIAGAAGGGVLLLAIIATCLCCMARRHAAAGSPTSTANKRPAEDSSAAPEVPFSMMNPSTRRLPSAPMPVRAVAPAAYGSPAAYGYGAAPAQ